MIFLCMCVVQNKIYIIYSFINLYEISIYKLVTWFDFQSFNLCFYQYQCLV